VHAGRALLLDEALEDEAEDLAGDLTGKGQADLDLASEEDEGDVDDAEALGDEGEVRAEERERVVGVLRGRRGKAWLARASPAVVSARDKTRDRQLRGRT
jgi:hypothetical protein